MKIKIIFQKIGKFLLTLFGLFAVNVMVSVVSYFFVMFLWAMVGDDNQYKMMSEVGYTTGIAMFALLSIGEIIWYSLKAST